MRDMQGYEFDVQPERPESRDTDDSPPPRRPSARRVGWILGLIALGFLGLFIFGYRHYRQRMRIVEAAAGSAEGSIPRVNVEQVRRAAPVAELLLPGNIAPLTEASIYARASGYVRRRLVDIGDRVRAGQLLAEIEAPEIDQQVQQAQAALAQSERQLDQAKADLGDARARLELARVTWERYKVLMEHGAVSRQEGDQQLAAFQSASAATNSVEARIGSAEQNVRAARANLERLLTIQGFERVLAPFDGIITARNFDTGALISGSGGSLGQGVGTGPGTLSGPSTGTQGGELLRIAQASVVRVLINVPESSAPEIRVGQSATILAQAFLNREFAGHVTRTANAVDVSSRTMLTEIQVRNPDLALMPGMYVQVRLQHARTVAPLLVSGNSVLTTPKGLFMAVLTDLPQTESAALPAQSQGRAKLVRLQEIGVGRDYGQDIEIISGLEGWEHYVLNPGDEVTNGAIVLPVSVPRAQSAAGKAVPQSGSEGKEGRR